MFGETLIKKVIIYEGAPLERRAVYFSQLKMGGGNNNKGFPTALWLIGPGEKISAILKAGRNFYYNESGSLCRQNIIRAEQGGFHLLRMVLLYHLGENARLKGQIRGVT